MNIRNSIAIIAVTAIYITSCISSNAPSSPVSVRATISPEPLVGREVNLHIEIVSSKRELPNTTLYVTLPPEIDLVSGETTWEGHIPANSQASVDLTIRVNTPGEWMVEAYAFSRSNPDTNNGFGGVKQLFITSSNDLAQVVEDVNRPTRIIPTLQIAPTNGH